MKKKLAVFIICIMTIGCLASCGEKDKTDKNTEETKKTGTDVVVGAKTDSYDSVEALTDKAATIVIGKKTGVEKVVSNVDGEGYWINGYTLCSFKISEIKKDKAAKLEVGDTITVLENEVYDENTGNTYHIAGYTAMNTEDDYILYLEHNRFQNGSDYYTPLAAVYGITSLGDDYKMVDYGEGVNEEVNTLRDKIRKEVTGFVDKKEAYDKSLQAIKEKYADKNLQLKENYNEKDISTFYDPHRECLCYTFEVQGAIDGKWDDELSVFVFTPMVNVNDITDIEIASTFCY